ncbi:MAG: glucan biosynthesis protein [Pseudolabrys sp.]
MHALSRRIVLLSGASLAVTGLAAPRSRAAAEPEQPQQPQLFDFAALRQRAKDLATKPYVAPKVSAADIVSKIDFDVVQKIKFRAEKALWGNKPGFLPVRLFHVDKFNPLPVRINVVADGKATPVNYSPQDFDYGDTGLEGKLPPDLGFSGFRVMDSEKAATDWLAFQGASYFRSSGEDNQYGGSARGIAVNTTASTKEEFPRFSEFWLLEPEPQSSSITIYALLDGPSLTGAYHFVATKQSGAIMDVQAQLFIRSDIAQLGIAPLTSMYWFGENDRRHATDWRPEIHDSDGLALWTGKGERIWRPLMNPPAVQTNSFLDENPKGFGLMQRDRDFADYQDDGAFYNRRPTMWIEPKGDWGAGAVQLVEIPTADEIHDNIVAYWIPKGPVKAGKQIGVAYRLFWQNNNPHPPNDVARVSATRVGRGGVPGHPSPEDKDSWKFVLDFAGGPLSTMAPRFDVEPVVTTSYGKVGKAYVIKVVGTDRWRALFDIHGLQKDKPVNLRCFLRFGGKTLTETWLYQYFPPA